MLQDPDPLLLPIINVWVITLTNLSKVSITVIEYIRKDHHYPRA